MAALSWFPSCSCSSADASDEQEVSIQPSLVSEHALLSESPTLLTTKASDDDKGNVAGQDTELQKTYDRPSAWSSTTTAENDEDVATSTPSTDVSVQRFALGQGEEEAGNQTPPSYSISMRSDELKALRALQAELTEKDLAAVMALLVPGESLESCLLRFVRTCSLRVPASAKMLRAHIAWREVNKPAELALRSPGDICGCSEELLDQFMPTWHQGFDRKGRPIVFSHYGKFRFKPVLDAGVTVERILQLHIHNSEHTARSCGEQSRKLGRDVSQALIIMDTEGWDAGNLRHRGAYEWARGLAKIDQEHYPERMGQLLIINAPASVHYFYKAVSWIFPEKARNQVRILGGREHWEPALKELIDPAVLPPEYGGTGPTPAALQTAPKKD